jgi:hypothetical protein
MNIRDQDLEIIIKSLQITPDAYALWKENIVTKRFFAEAELELSSIRQYPMRGNTCEQIALATVSNSSICDKLEEILKWKPMELQVDE